ncbi:MAG: zinc ribbon domain-containing protein [Chloroflexi bacterium]|nr:zinc ribbon domain-containing protein [Chloroflexota bacterium]
MQITGKMLALFGALLVGVYLIGAIIAAPFGFGMMRGDFGMGGRFLPGFGLHGVTWLIVAAFVVLGIVWLAQRPVAASPTTAPNTTASVPATKPCPNCQRATQNDWRVCAYCGHTLIEESPAQA